MRLSEESRREQNARYAAMTRQVWTAFLIALSAVAVTAGGLWWGGWW